MIRPWRWLAAVLAAGGCVQTSLNPATQRQDYTFTSIESEVATGRRLARRVEKELPRLEDERVQERVRALGGRLVAVCDRRDLVYQFEVLEGEEVNAFALPGGYVYIYQGLVDKTASDDELAGVLAHEIGHIAARHSIKHYEAGIGAQLLQLATLVTRQPAAIQGTGLSLQAARLAYARDDELEADRLGVKYLKAAGFNAGAMVHFLEVMEGVDQQEARYLPRGIVRPQYALTHPFIPDRIRTVKESLYGVADYLDYLNTQE